MPKLTIITVNLNNGIGLYKTINSVLKQTFKDFEFIIIDGKSNDDSVEIINKFHNEISYWCSEPDTGIYNAMNKGIKKSKGQYLLFLNSGDFLYNSSVLANIFEIDPNEDIIYGNRCNIIGDKEISITIFPKELSLYKFYKDTIGHQSTLIKRNLFDKLLLYDEGLSYASDWEFFMICFMKYNCSYRHLDLIVCCYDMEGISAQASHYAKMMEERRNVFKKHFPFIVNDYIELNKLKNFYNDYLNQSFTKTSYEFLRYLFKGKRDKVYKDN